MQAGFNHIAFSPGPFGGSAFPNLTKNKLRSKAFFPSFLAAYMVSFGATSEREADCEESHALTAPKMPKVEEFAQMRFTWAATASQWYLEMRVWRRVQYIPTYYANGNVYKRKLNSRAQRLNANMNGERNWSGKLRPLLPSIDPFERNNVTIFSHTSASKLEDTYTEYLVCSQLDKRSSSPQRQTQARSLPMPMARWPDAVKKEGKILVHRPRKHGENDK